MLKFACKCILMVFGLLSVSCSQSKSKEILYERGAIAELDIPDTIEFERIGVVKDGKYIIKHDIDLKGGVCLIPQGITLIKKSGLIKNGTLIGNNTKIITKSAVFDKVKIKGSWEVQDISTKLFADLNYENSLRDVVALANPKIPNRIVIDKGLYRVKANKNADVCVALCSNTEFILNGTIQIVPNYYKNYYILQASGKNITIKGKGTIIGDKHHHTGSDGEWGMGINLKRAVNTTVSSLTIKDCWGDCIYVGGRSKNVLIENCRLVHGRRQGISVTKAAGVTIRNCIITNVSGTNPQYAIDIEPNRKDSVDDIWIEKVVVRDCEGGFLVTRGTQKDSATVPWIGNVTIRDCKVNCKSKYPVRITRCEAVNIEKCVLNAPQGLSAIQIANVDEVRVQDNTISVSNGMIDKIKNELRNFVGKGRRYPIDIRTTKKNTVRNNKILQNSLK